MLLERSRAGVKERRPLLMWVGCFVTLVSLSAFRCWAQFTSAIEGTVTDPSGAVVPSADVSVQNETTGTVRTTPTTQAGYYRFTALPASSYTVRVENPGFNSTVQRNIQLQVSEIKTVNIPLKLGTEATVVIVTGDVPQVETGESRVSALIPERKLHDLPLVGRNFYGLVLLTPGVTGLPSSSGDIFNTNYAVDLYAGGHRAESNNFLVDSASVTSTPRGGRVNLSPNVDSVQEIRVSVNNFSAEYGRNAAALVNVVTKQGTNQWHGTASWFFSTNSLTSRTFFQPEVPGFDRNQLGGSLGGPIHKDRTFVFGSFEGLRSGGGIGSAVVVATPEFINFMEQNRPNNISTRVWKSFPSQVTPVRNFLTAGQLAGVNCSSLAAPSTPISSPVGSIPCNFPVTGEGDFAATVSRNGFQWNSRLDHVFNNALDRLYANLYRTTLKQGGAFVYPDFNVTNPSYSLYSNLNETHVFSPRMIHEAAFSYIRIWGQGEVRLGEIPLIFVRGIAGFGTGIGPSLSVQNNFEFRDSLTFTRAAHSIKLGGILQRGQSNGDFTGLSLRPGFLFSSPLEFANDNPHRQVNISFDPVAGGPKGLVQAIRTRTIGLFVQDDWKLRRNLTINLGLRWETFGNPTDANNRMTNLVFRGGNDFSSRIADAKVDLVPALYREADLNNWAPRVGFAWDPTGRGKTSIRGGFGIFYDRPSDQIYINASRNTPLIAVAEASLATPPVIPRFALGTIDEPPYNFPIPAGIQPGLDDKNGLASGGRVQLLASDPNFRSQYAENWFLGIQYALTADWLLEMNYLGSAGHKLYGQTDVNRFNGDLIQNNGILTRLNRSFGVIEYGESNLNSAYHAGAVSVKKRFSGGLSFDGAYTLSKAIDQFSTFHPMGGAQLPVADLTNLRRQRGPADFDARQRLAWSMTWQLPARISSSDFLNKVVGGWEVTNITILQSGLPFSVICSRPFAPVRDGNGLIVGNSGCDYNADGFNYDFPNTPRFGNSQTGLARSDYIRGIFTRADFPAPALGRQGDLGRNTFRGPGYAGTDFSILKNIQIPFTSEEGATVQFRIEVFNLFNRVNLGSVNGDLASPQFGRSTTTLPARNIQFGLRLEF